jgi:DNA-binding MarR family transcriptional regulator
MPTLESKARHLTEYLQHLINRFQVLKINTTPPEYEFNFRELRVIQFLGFNGPCIMREIADNLGMVVSTATGIVDRLVDKDLVLRERPEEDRRIVKVELTDKGREVYQWDFDEHTKMVRELLESLDEQDQKLFVTLMKKIAAGSGLNPRTDKTN